MNKRESDSWGMICRGVAHKRKSGRFKVELPRHFALECRLPGDASLRANCTWVVLSESFALLAGRAELKFFLIISLQLYHLLDCLAFLK
jgi:hypothetical protein